jgi:hypothetical protein
MVRKPLAYCKVSGDGSPGRGSLQTRRTVFSQLFLFVFVPSLSWQMIDGHTQRFTSKWHQISQCSC